MTKSLLEFPTELWDQFKDKISPYKSQKYVIENLIKVFLGKEADNKIENELRRMLKCK